MDEAEGLIKRHRAFEKLLSSQEEKVRSAHFISVCHCAIPVMEESVQGDLVAPVFVQKVSDYFGSVTGNSKMMITTSNGQRLLIASKL